VVEINKADRKGPVDLSTVKVISDSFFYSISRISVLVLKLVKGIVLPRLLGPRLYGILNIPAPYILISSMLSNIGFNTSVLKLMPDYLQQGRPDLARMIYRSTAFMTVALSALWAVLLLVFSPWLVDRVAHEPDAVNPMRIYALAIPFLAVNTYFASVYMAVQRGKLGAAISFVYGVLNTALPIAAVLWHRNVTIVVGGIVAAEVLGATLFTFYFHDRVLSRLRSAAGPLWRGIKETVSFGFLFFIAGLGWNLINSVDRLMIKFYLPAAQLGFYSMAAQVYTMLNIVASTLGFALVPSLTAAKNEGEQAVFDRLVHNAARIGFMALVPIVAGVFVLAPDVFSLLLPRFGPSVVIVQITIFIGFIYLFASIAWAALVAHGRGGLSAWAHMGAAAWNIAMNRFLIPRYGIAGAAVSVLSTIIVLTVTLLVMMDRVSRTRIAVKTLLHPLALACVYPLLGYLLRGRHSIARIIVVAIAGSLLYLALAIRTGLIRQEDFTKARELLLRRSEVPHVRLARALIDILERSSTALGGRKGRG
jgi:O-antigen/teichoic acid export membrane protein